MNATQSSPAKDAADAMRALKAAMTALTNLEDSLLDDLTSSDSLAMDVRKVMESIAESAEELTLIADCIPGSALA